MSPWPPEGDPEGKGTRPVTLPRPGHADLAGTQKFGLADVRDALERASARHTAVHVAAGAVAKALLAHIGIEVTGSAPPEAGADPAAVDAAKEERDSPGGVVDVSAVEALAVVAEAAVAWELARAAREKFGGDALGDFVTAWRAYLERIDWTPR